MNNRDFKNLLDSDKLVKLIKSELDINTAVTPINQFDDELNQFNLYLTDSPTDRFVNEFIMFSLIFEDQKLIEVKAAFHRHASIARLKIIADVAVLTENYLKEIFA